MTATLTAPVDGPPTRARLSGVDTARGVALLGMIAVHALVESTPDGAPTAVYLVFGGRAAALFAVLAGVSISFLTGRARVRGGVDARAAAAMLATRAAALLVIGLALGWTDPSIASVILPYYAVLFLIAIPLVLLPTWAVSGLAVVVAGGMPVLSQLVRPGLPAPSGTNPSFGYLLTDPLGLLSELTLTGAYPALPWAAYICAGIAVGRLRLSSVRTAAWLLVGGVAGAVVATGVSAWLLGPMGGLARIAAATPADQLATAPTVADYVTGFPEGTNPTTTWWWLAGVAPHSATPPDLVQTGASALAVIGAGLLLAHVTRPGVGRAVGHLTRPLGAAGSMTLTLYVASVLFMNSPLDQFDALPGYLWQVAVALVFGVAWRRAVGRGPLESIVSVLATGARDRVRRNARPGGREPDDRPAGTPG